MASSGMRSKRLRNALLGLTCALVLVAQHVGIAHAVWHAYQQLPVQESGIGGEDRPFAPELTRLCAFDAALGQVLGCAPPPQNLFILSSAANVLAAAVPRARTPAESLSPRSRGPPALH